MRAYTIHILTLLTLLIVLFFFDLMMAGNGMMNVYDFNASNYVFTHIRLTKAITAVLCGLSLPVAGQILQVLFRNPLAGPYVLGISSASSLFVAFAVMILSGISTGIGLVFSKSLIIGFAFAGSLFCTLLILFVSGRVRSNVFLLLIGLMLAQVFGALQSFIEYFSSDKSLREFLMWSYGSIGNCSYTDLAVFAMVSVTLIVIMTILMKPFQVFLLGQNYATALGVNFYRYRLFFILISSMLTAVTTAFCGPIAFIGISVPIMSRLIFKTSDQRFHLFASALLGAIIMLVCDIIGHNILGDQFIPINIITTLIGSPFIIYLLFKTKTW